jgi:hypothetical protein
MSYALVVYDTPNSLGTLIEQEKQVVYDEYRRRLARGEALAALGSAFTGALAAIRRLRRRDTNRQGEVEARPRR